MQKFGLLTLLFIWSVVLVGQNKNTGKITGTIVEKGSGLPVEYANIQLFNLGEKTLVDGTISDQKGNFTFKSIPIGSYRMTISFIGYETSERSDIRISKEQNVFNTGKIILSSSSQDLGEVAVVGRKSTYAQSIDKKVFSVGDDLTSSTGSVSDLMQNIPSLQVDIEGNVSLRGSENVQILINGKPSALMGKNRAAILEQLPANSVERIEIITNPSAKYKPDGTAGIINLILKKERKEGLNGNLTGNIGNNNRYNSTTALNYHKGGINLLGSYGFRQDYRDRHSKDNRAKTDTITGVKNWLYQTITSTAQPVSHLAQTGLEWEINDKNSLEAEANYTRIDFIREENNLTQNFDQNHQLTSAYNRYRYDPEYEKELEMAAKYTRKLGEDQELTLDYTHSNASEQEDNHYTNQYFLPAMPDSKDITLIRKDENKNLLRTNFVSPMPGEGSQLELGYELEADYIDMNYKAENQIGTKWVADLGKSNRFRFGENIHAIYATYQHVFGKLGILAGLRGEQAYVTSNLVTLDSIIRNNYFAVYPTMHTSYDLNKTNQLQLNYSKRVSRPDEDNLNPFPEYQDPYNLKSGNPNLKPEQIHSIEAGYLNHNGATTYSGSIYCRYNYNKFTEITKFINDSVLLTTIENLSSGSAAGIEAIVNSSLGKFATVNLNINGYFSQLDAANLGYSSSKTAFGWFTSFNTNISITKALMVQVNLKYTSSSQTPQGERLPTFIVNAGARYDIWNRKASLMLTVSDLFDTFRSRTIIDIPELHREAESRRTPRIIYLGFNWRFGENDKKGKDEQLKYEE